jgi:transitional endoplasmic reticulum ATPase
MPSPSLACCAGKWLRVLLKTARASAFMREALSMNAPFIFHPAPAEVLDRARLSPAQEQAYARMLTALDAAPIVSLVGNPGTGKTTLLRLLAHELGGVFLSLDDMVDAALSRDIIGCGDSILMTLEQAFDAADVVVLDGHQVLTDYTFEGHAAPIALEMIRHWIEQGQNRRFIMGGPEAVLGELHAVANRYWKVRVEDPACEEYRTVLANMLPPGALDQVDMDLVWRHASALTGHMLHMLGGFLRDLPTITTQDVIDRLDRSFIKANVKTQEVEALSFETLPGTQGIAQRLETHVMLPLEQPELARRLSLKPKRGVLLYGPPGTGKTSIGRALAHRMQGRFFLIDGSITTEPPVEFFAKVKGIVAQAKDNAPSVLFVDDADVLFGIEHIAGFPRYLLSLLDGVESEGAGRVCLMMTAMNAERIPGSILRSGRVELWLETRLPDAQTRADMLARWVDVLPSSAEIDLAALARVTEGFTPADLRRVVSDAHSLYAMDRIARRDLASAQAYVERAIDSLIALRAKMADNLADESLRITSLSRALDAKKARYGAGIGGLVEWQIANPITNAW